MLRGYQPHGRKVICDVCGFYKRQGEMRKGVFGKQKGLEVCPDCFDSVHPNERPVRSNLKEGKLDEIR